MDLSKVNSGAKAPQEVNVIIEIPANSVPVKYEVDKETGAMFVDRFLRSSMHYPCNYGYVPNTLSDDGDPVDVLVLTPVPLITGSVIKVRPIAMLSMVDESGIDAKILAVPADKLTPVYREMKGPQDVSQYQLEIIEHFFAHYKDLEPNKWVKIEGWLGVEDAQREIMESIKRYQEKTAK
jgi:inorganic pyrophosphatase